MWPLPHCPTARRIPFRGTPSIIDLTSAPGGAGGKDAVPHTKLAVASGVQEARIECLEKERDALLYYLLAR